MSKQITVDTDTLDALIEAKVQARLAAQVPPDPLQKRLEEARKAVEISVTTVECESPTTGARFTAEIQTSRTFPRGRITTLLNYREPAGVDKHVNEGGLCPDGMEIWDKDERGRTLTTYSTPFRKWKAENYFRADLAAWVGKPYQPYLSVEDADKRRAMQAPPAPKVTP